jgi:phosphoglycolate phosphatase/beta-phosphoglucomutase
MIAAIFFDFNGVIIDDERIHLKAYREVLAAEDVALTDEDYFASLGMDDVAFVQAAYRRAARSLTDETMRALIKREHELHRQFITDELPVSSGVVTFIREASRHYELGIVSMAPPEEIMYALRSASIEKCFSIIVSSSDVGQHKPAPECYRRALEFLNEQRRVARTLPLLPQECLAIEDSPTGIESADTAGMRSIGVTGTVSERDLRIAGAEIVTPNLADWSIEAVRRLFD